MQFDLFDQTQNEILDLKTYDEFKRALSESNCTRCALSSSRRHIVVDRGNPNSKVLMIGEGPGEHEDLQAKAFVGRAGQLLDELMLQIGFDTPKTSPGQNRFLKLRSIKLLNLRRLSVNRCRRGKEYYCQ